MGKASKNFLSCDWGTSIFRLKLVDTLSLSIIAEENSNEGIADTYERWQGSGLREETRLSFYLDVIHKHLNLLEQKTKISLQDMPLIVSGMASSTIGMMEIPYKALPFSTDGSDLCVKTNMASSDFPCDVYIISGVKTDIDVMRGEETQLVGCITEADQQEQVFILPGTHSKHITVKNGQATAFQTYMTGEFFNLLSNKSILSVSVEGGEGLLDEKNMQAFEKGVLDSTQLNLLHSCFLVRTNHLFKKMDRHSNYYYLSGLLIGAEVEGIAKKKSSSITVVSNALLKPFYVKALELLLAVDVKTKSADEAIVRGQFNIYNSYN